MEKKRGRKVKYTEDNDKLQLAFELYKDSPLSLVVISLISGITRQTLYTKLKEFGHFDPRRRVKVFKHKIEGLNEAVEVYFNEDLTVKEVSDIVHIPVGKLEEYFKKYHVT